MSKEAAKTPKAPSAAAMDLRELGRTAGLLLAICAAVALLLGITNFITSPIITRLQAEKTAAAMAAVLPADEYLPWEGSLPEHVTALYFAKSGGEGVGWVAETSTSGSQGAIAMVVGVDMAGCVTGVSVTSHKETANLGSKVVADQAVLDRFLGMSHELGEITVNSGANRFDGVSGATVSSRGVAAGVNAALDAVSELVEKEG